MKYLASTVLLGLLALGGSIAEVNANANIYTQWVTEYVTVNDCSPPSTTITVCDVCTPCVITAWTQCITSTTTSTYPTSTWCPQPGYYDECACTIDYPQWVYYDTDCDVEYVCPYQDWYYLNTKVVEVYVKVNNVVCNTVTEEWNIIVVPTPVVTYIINPTVIVVNDITIDVTIAPTYITYTTDVTKTETKTITATVYPSASPTGNVNPDSHSPSMGPSSIPSMAPTAPGSIAPSAAPSASPSTGPSSGDPVSTFKLTTTIDGSGAVIMQQSGSLVLTPADDSTTAVSFTLLSNGEMMTADGQYVSLTFTDEQAGEFTYGPKLTKRELLKRAIADGTYYGNFTANGGFGMTIDGEGVTIQVCGDANILSGGVGIMNGCTGINVESEPVDTAPSSSPSAPSSTAIQPPSTAPSTEPTGTSEPTGPTGTTGPSEPTNTGVISEPGSTGGSPPTTTGGSEPTTTGDSNPTASPSGPEPSGPSFPNNTNNTTNARRARLARRMKFKYN